MQTDLPTLIFLPVENLVIHESHDTQRARPLALGIQASGILKNPPIVSPLQDGTQRYMVLDGANRVTALREMGYPHALVQTVGPDNPGLNLENWNHVVWEMNARRFLTGIRDLPDLRLQPADVEVQPELEDGCGLAVVISCRGNPYEVCTQVESLKTRVDLLNAIVNSYKERARLDRTNMRSVETLHEIYPHLSGVVIFPNFQIRDVMRLAGEGYLLPSGITRFTISPRALHINYPLEELAADKSLEQKNDELRKWIQERIAQKGVRYYAEATFLFDE